MPGKHKPGYRAPRTGQKRQTRQPFAIDKMDEKVREEIQRRRAAGDTWTEISEASASFAGKSLAVSVLQRWYDVRVEQVNADVLAQAEKSRALAAAFTGKEFKDLPEATMNALAAQVFEVMERQGKNGFEASLGNLGFILSKMITAQAKAKMADLEVEKLGLAKKKFEQLKAKAEKVTNEAATKLEGGKQVTLKDINRIRERTFGLPPIQRSAAAGNPA